jgi:hypothetical protein
MSSYPLLMSANREVLLLNAERRRASIFTGLLCIRNSTRYRLTEPLDVDLYAQAEFVATVRLGVELSGDRNGYTPNTTLPIA